MRKPLFTLLLFILIAGTQNLQGQCTSSKLNWDQLDYYYNSGNNIAPYGHNSGGTLTHPTGGYIRDDQEMEQRFAIGRTAITISTSAAGIVRGENATHTGDIAGYTGADAQFTPTANGQAITLTFEDVVSDVSFALYDVDRSQRIDFAARNDANILLPVNVTAQSTANVTVNGNGGASAYITSVNTNHATTSNNGTVTVSVSGPVKQIVLTITSIGSNAVFWLSDIDACVTNGAFPINYHRLPAEQPFAGQVPYFLVTPDNQSAYMMDTLGRVWHLFTDAQYGTGFSAFINSFAYDQKNHLLYYVAERSNSDSTVKTLKRYNFNTNTIQVVGDLETLTGIPMFDQGIQSGGAAFYDDALYIGIEGGRHIVYNSGSATSINTAVTRESIVWRIDIPDTTISSFAGYKAKQVWAMPAYNSSSNTLHDWGDLLVRDGMLIDFNTARQGSSPFTYPNSAFHHYNLVTGDMTQYSNPLPTTSGAAYTGQGGLDWFGNMWVVRNNLQRYNNDGTMGESKSITSMNAPAWVGGAGDAAEPFRPKMDFGDAPAAYEPDPLSPAVHEITSDLRLGNTIDVEWEKKPSGNAYVNADADGAEEDGVSSLNPITNASTYLTQVSVFNNTGSPATLIAWLDYDRDNVFESSEAVTVSVPSSNSMQTHDLFWSGMTNTPPDGTTTYLRIRITSTANGMTTSNPTGYFINGEVEDYPVLVNKIVLAARGVAFQAQAQPEGAAQLNWNVTGNGWERFVVERSADGTKWLAVGTVSKNEQLTGKQGYYQYDDLNAGTGTVYYRLQLRSTSGQIEYSEIKVIQIADGTPMLVVPNPVSYSGSLWIYADKGGMAGLEIINLSGVSLWHGTVTLQKGKNKINLPAMQTMPPGRYTILVRCYNKIKQVSFVRQ